VRLAVLVDRWHPRGGGLEAWTRAVAPRLAARGHEVFLVARRASRRPPAGVCPVPLAPLWRPGRSRRDAAFAAAAARRLRSLAPDRVLDLRAAGLPGAALLPMGGLPAPAPDVSARRRALAERAREAARRAALVLAPSPRVLRELRDCAPAVRGELLPLPLLEDPRPRLHPPRPPERASDLRPLRVLHCGRDAARHGMRPALAWARALRRRLGHVRFEGWTRRPSRAVLGEGLADLADDVVLHGWDGAFRAALPRADLLVHPTAYDSFSLVCLEAAAVGVPVVTTPACGAADLLPESLVRRVPRDDPEAAAAAALELLAAAAADPERVAADAAALRRDFALERHVDRLEALLASIPPSLPRTLPPR